MSSSMWSQVAVRTAKRGGGNPNRLNKIWNQLNFIYRVSGNRLNRSCSKAYL